MKKIVAIFYILIVILSCFLLSGCNLNDELDIEASEQLIEDYNKEFESEISAEKLNKWYCGTYRGNIAFYPVNLGAYMYIMEVEVAGIEYTYPDSRQILIYSDGEFYTIAGAFEKGLIGYFDIYAIYYRHDLNVRANRQQ